MWQNYTEQARRAIFFAQQDATLRGENYITTDHLLLGLLKEDDNAAVWILERMAISLDALRDGAERQITHSTARTRKDMQLTGRSKRTLELAVEEAKKLKHDYIGTDHLLLGLIIEGDGRPGRILSKLGVDIDRARIELKNRPADHIEKAVEATVDVAKKGDVVIDIATGSDEGSLTKWQYLTIRGRRVINYARQEAQRVGAVKISTEHLLHALTRENDSVVAFLFERLNVSGDHLRSEIEQYQPTAKTKGSKDLLYSPRALRSLDYAFDEAKLLAENFIGTEHIFLGLVREGEGLSGRILAELGLEIEDVRASVISLNEVHD